MSIFKESFKPNVSASLAARQNAMLQRSPNDIRYINSRNAWIRMSSGVNIYKNDAPNPPTFDDLANDGNYDNSLAKKYILFGGVLNEDGSPKVGIGNWNNAYSRTSAEGENYRLGIRPLPGIISIDVKSRGAYGSLRDVTVNFQCWDIKQLEDLELLYMRPGYSVLIEWGWAPYLDTNGNIQTNVQFYDIIDTVKSKEQIWQDLESKSQGSSLGGNYEAMFGFVKNYSWSARPDGGYDCQTTIISMGEIIESLKINYTPLTILENIGKNGYLTPNIKGKTEVSIINQEEGFLTSGRDIDVFSIRTESPQNIGDEELKEQYSKNILAGMFWELWRISYAQINTSALRSTTSDKGELVSFTDTKTNVTFDVFHKTINIKTQNSNLERDEQFYITLETLCYLLNNYVLLQEKNGTNSTETKPYAMLSVREDKDYKAIKNTPTGEEYLLCTAHPLQISVDPSICLIRNDLWTNGINFNIERPTEIDPKTGNSTIRFRSNINNVGTFVEEIIRNTIPVNSIGNKEALANFIKNTIQGPENSRYSTEQIKENIKEVTRIFREEKYNTYKIGPPTKSASFSLSFDATSSAGKRVGKTIKETLPLTNTFLDLLDDLAGANLDRNVIEDILGGSENISIADSDPVVEEQEKIQKQEEKLQETSDEAKENLEFLTKLLPYFKDNKYQTELGIIGNIYVNIQHLYNLALNNNLAAQDRKEKNDVSVYDFMKNLLKEISSSIGNVSTLEVYIEPNASIAKIIDIAFTGEKNIYDTAFVLEVQGLKTTARSYKLESKIFQEQSTMIAIGAQAGGGALSADVTTLVDFNKKIIDRIVTQKISPVDGVNQKSIETLSSLTESLKILYKFFAKLNFNLFVDADFDISEADKYKNALKDLINLFKSLVSSDGNNRAIIPTSFSVDIDGVGGIIIGNIFRIPNDVLPKGYKGKGVGSKLGYIVTGLGHSIQNGDWVTKIESQTIILDEPFPSVKSFPKDFDYTNITITLNPTSASGGNIKNIGKGSISKDNIKYPLLIKKEEFKKVYDPIVQKNAIVSNSTPVADALRKQLNKQYITEKEDELSSNGDITESLKQSILIFQSKLISTSGFEFIKNNPIVITAGNDTYHREYDDDKRNNTTHGRGLAIDIRTKTYTQSQINNIMDLLRTSEFVYVIYHGGSALHIHANISTN